MKKLTGNQVRQMFLDYFAQHGHMVEPGASLVPHNDPTLLWINAGVAALKKYFDGSEKPKCPRITNAQKSIRTNDIENVGKTARHHTFFEMLGNFSIGDYFKEEAIQYAWEFLTSPEWIGFDKEKLYISVYPDDEVAYNTWVNVCKVDPSHILKTEDNFWEIGEGPSGPDSEIFYDRGEKYDPEGLGEKLFFEEMENDRYIEVWNVVFSQYDAKPGIDRSLYKELPQKNIDTGMGLERLVSLIQEGETNFDTDLFLPVIHQCEALCNHKYAGEYKMAYRVIADHIRTVTFAIADGALFSNEGRGYVLRRVLRRAVRYGIKLGIEKAFMYQLVDTVCDNMQEFYPYLQERKELIKKLVKIEEETFHKTLANGEKLLVEQLENNPTKVLDGETVFKLYDTYGFPKELTAEIAEDYGFSVDLAGFDVKMQEQKDRARNARADLQSMNSQSIDLMNFETESKFIGYTNLACNAKVIGLFKDGVKVDELADSGEIILDQTCFYAESGGQVADTGNFIADHATCDVIDVKKAPHKQHLHFVDNIQGTIKLNDEFKISINQGDRLNTKANHSSLHLLQSALRKIIGTHVTQAGSYCSCEYGRFDFTHYEKLTAEQIDAIELEVNAYIMQDNLVKTEVLSVEQAKETGAIALFDEKYGDSVRVVSMGDVSKEFCGGTHVNNTQEIGLFKIINEESIGSGIRRITCVTKMKAYKAFHDKETVLKNLANNLKLNSVNLVETKVSGLIADLEDSKREIADLKQKNMVLKADQLINQAKEINGINFLCLKLDNADGKSLKNYAEVLRDKLSSSLVFIANISNEKVTYVVACSKEVIKLGHKAGDIAKMAAVMSGGNGGGKPDIAQAGGKDTTKFLEICNAIELKLK